MKNGAFGTQWQGLISPPFFGHIAGISIGKPLSHWHFSGDELSHTTKCPAMSICGHIFGSHTTGSCWFILKPIFWKLRPCLLNCVILQKDRIPSHSPNFRQQKKGQTFVVPTFHIHFLNPEYVRIPWVLAPKKFPIENFRVRSDLQKSSIFHWFLCPQTKKSIGLVYPQFWCHRPSQ